MTDSRILTRAAPRVVARLLSLLDALAKSQKEGLDLAELAALLNSPKSSLLGLLRPLVATGYVHLQFGTYRLGPPSFRLAGNIMSVWNFSNVVHPFLEELAAWSRESVYLGVLDKADKVMTYVDAIDSPHSLRYSVPTGAVQSLHSTAAGRVLLAFADSGLRDEYIAGMDLQGGSGRTILSRATLREELERVRTTLVSIGNDEIPPEFAAIAAPIFGADGVIVAAIALGGPVARVGPRLSELRPIIADIAARASVQLFSRMPPSGFQNHIEWRAAQKKL